MYYCKNKKILRSNCPKRIISIVGEIIYKRKEAECLSEDGQGNTIMSEMKELKQKLEDLQKIVEELQL